MMAEHIGRNEHRDWVVRTERSSRARWSGRFWVVGMAGVAAILAIALLLQYSEEGYLRRNGIRVTAFVTELPSGEDSCLRCPLEFTIDGERYYVKETLVAGYEDRRYSPGEAIDLYVDPGDMTHTIEVAAVQHNIAFGLIGVFIAGAFTLGWPIYELKRPIPT